ncbi:MAG: hypothetical protein K9N62_15900 [Verrucomicrobia bacterium]|nr:hypothetical protein [Verrucomicrobiota bacterium]
MLKGIRIRQTIVTLLAALFGVSAQAGQATFDFNADPTASLEIGGNNPAPWVESGGNPGGFLAITYPTGGQYTGFVFPDIDNGGIITSFKFEADLRVGNSTGDRAADGFSISIARASDPLLQDIGSTANFAGTIPEGGSKTGIAISFDTWAGNTYSDGGDIEGILVRVDDKTVLRHSVPTRHGACADATSLQTGPRDADYWANGGDPVDPASWAGLCWQPLVVNLDDAAKLTVIWKGVTILDAFQTDFFPSAGRLVLAGRTGGANEHTHIDNIKLTTVAATVDTQAPTAPGNIQAGTLGARRVNFTWGAATDNSGRVGYEVDFDGVIQLVPGTSFSATGLLPNSQHTIKVRAVDVSANASAWKELSVTTVAEVDGVGFLLGEIYDNIPGTDVFSLTASEAFFEKKPSRGVYVNGLNFDGYGDNYGIVIKGVLTAPKTGRFDFFVRSDDASQFFLNGSGAGIPDIVTEIPLAEETGCCNAFQEPGAMQTSFEPVSLQAGKQYGFAFVVKEGGGGDWGQVAMREVGDPTPAGQLSPIQGAILTGKGDPVGAELTITQGPKDTTAIVGRSATFTVNATHTSPYGVGRFYQWYRNGALIVGATKSSYRLNNLTAADSGAKFNVLVGTLGKSATSAEATLSVVPDTFPPVPSAGALAKGGKQEVGVGFDEDIKIATANVMANYSLSGGTIESLRVVNRPATGFAAGLGVTEYNGIVLTVSGLTPGQSYDLTVRNVEDLKGNKIPAAGTTVSFKAEKDLTWNVIGAKEAGFANADDVVRLGEGEFDVVSSGVAFWADYDEGTFVNQKVEGDFDAKVQLIEQDPSSQWARTGLMAREALDEGKGRPDRQDTTAALVNGEYTIPKENLFSRLQDVHANPSINWDESGSNNGFENHYRDETTYANGWGDQLQSAGFAVVPAYPNVWMRLKREGENLITYRSEDGETWTEMVNRNFPKLASSLYVGISYMPELGNNGARDGLGHGVLAKFRNYSITLGSGGGDGGGGGGGMFHMGLNFGADEPAGAGTFALAASDMAGAPGYIQSNWNNLTTLTGSAAGMIDGGGNATAVTVDWSSNNTWASTGRGETNGDGFKPGTADAKLMGGYLDTGAPTTTTVTISNIPVTGTYDVVVYANGGVAAGRSGAYRIVDAVTGAPLSDYVRSTSATSPTDYMQVPMNLPEGEYGAGTHIVFSGIKGANIKVEATTIAGLGAGNPARAPINALQIVSPSMGGGGGGAGKIGVARGATGITVTFDGTLQSADSILGPFTDVPGATSPATIPFSGSGKFYRFRK